VRNPPSRWLRGAAAILTLLFALRTVAAQPAPDVGGERAASAWLKLVDDGEYAQSWQDSSSYFRSRVTESDWVSTIASLRQALGGLASRELASTGMATSLPGGPDGHYVVILYDTSFTGKRSATETVIMMLDKDGQYRLAGYFIR
jgi:Protein of unknown function (DUF4019)